jgi:hypothetical protein
MAYLTIYRPEGVHTKANPCNCKYCAVYPEFFHAKIYKSYNFMTYDKQFGILERDQFYPDGVILWSDIRGYTNGNSVTREDGSVITYNKKEHLWYESNGDLHSRK